MQGFSNLNRTAIASNLRNESFDMLIIGGGITGAGIALDAASRGLKVALVEKNDFASGTSSKSTKLIHGGLRYLKQFDFWLVKEVGSERAIIHNLAPHLVVPDKMILPIIENGTYGSWLTSIGLKIYDILASVEGDDKRKMLDKEEALLKEPLLPEDVLEGAGYYAEYRTDDARLTIEVLKTAVRHGALALNYCEITKLTYTNGKISGALAHDLLQNESLVLKAKYVINATGPWVDELRDHMDISHGTGKRLQLTKGVHLVFPFEKFPVKQSIYFDVPDGRMIFGIPRGKITYVGTTDTKYQGDPQEVQTDLADAMYLIEAVNHMFPEIELELDDVQSSWAGLRPLIYEEGKTAGELSRKDEIFESATGLISIAGGKLTGYRKMAERIVDLVDKKREKEYDLDLKPVQTETIRLTENPFKNYKEVKDYIKELLPRLEGYGFDKTDLSSLVHRYGKQLALVLEKFDTLTDRDAEIRLAKAELWYGLNFEMVAEPLDFFERRTGRLFFDSPGINKLKEPILKEFSKVFKWDKAMYQKQLNILEEALVRIKHFE
jgi:glycerol-3-phosphate dehydrogenase